MRRATTLLLLLVVSALTSFSQQTKSARPTKRSTTSTKNQASLAKSGSSAYTYSIVLDGRQSVAGKHVVEVLGLDINDVGDIVVWARCDDGTGIWSRNKGTWIVFTGKPITTADKYPAKTEGIFQPSLGPDGSVRYRAEYHAINPKTLIGDRKDGYFIDDQLIYEQIWGAGDDGLFTPDRKVILYPFKGNVTNTMTGALNTTMSLNDTSHIEGPGTPLPLANLGLTGLSRAAINKTTGHYTFFGTFQSKDGGHNGIFLNNTLSTIDPFDSLSFDRVLYINAHDDIAYGDRNGGWETTYINGQLSPHKGHLSGFSDDRDMLLISSDLRTGVRTLKVNDSLVLRTIRPESPLPGVPYIDNLGAVYAFSFSSMNNKRQVAFAAKFSLQNSYMVFNQNHPWQVVLASPTSMPSPPQSSPPSLLVLANLSRNIYSGNAGYGDFTFIGNNCTVPPNTCMNVGLAAAAYATPDATQIVIAIRGTVFSISGNNAFLGTTASDNRLQTLSNLNADVSFGGPNPHATLVADVSDASAFVQAIRQRYPLAKITLTGHSLGGAIAQLIGKASGYPTYVFNAPGSASLYNNLLHALTGFSDPQPSFINVNYRLYGDQVSLYGQPVGTIITLQDPPYTTLSVKEPFDAVYLLCHLLDTFLHLHAIDTVIAQIADNARSVSRQGEPNLTTVIPQVAAQAVIGKTPCATIP